jgi:hypothetical protein
MLTLVKNTNLGHTNSGLQFVVVFVMKTVATKMGIKEGVRARLVNAPPDAVDSMELPKIDIGKRLAGEFNYIHLFVKTQADFKKNFPKLKSHLAPRGMLWVSWPKGRQLESDLSLPTVINIGYSFGLVESTTLSINETWSAIKFTHPKEGKVYKNSYGVLKR